MGAGGPRRRGGDASGGGDGPSPVSGRLEHRNRPADGGAAAGSVSSLCLAGNTAIRDADLARLAPSSGLIELDLARTRVTDDCLDAVAAIKSLRHVSVVGSGVSSDGADRLRRALPECAVSSASLITDAIRGRSLFDEDRTTEPPQ